MSEDSNKISAVLVYQSSPASGTDGGMVARARARLSENYPDTPVYVGGQEEAASAPDAAGEVEVVRGDLFTCLSTVLEATAGNDQDSAAIFRDWYPLLDLELAREMAADHFRYLAHYTYSDNVPPGLIPDLASLEFTRAVPTADIAGTDLREYVFKNVNRFDVEIFYRLPDLRQFRLDLSTASARSRRLAEGLHERAPSINFAGLKELLASHPDLLRPYPSYIEIELSRAAPCLPGFAPRPEDFAGQEPAPVSRPAEGETGGDFLDEALIDKLLADLERNSLHDVSVALAGIGEPLRHPRADAVIARLLEHASVRRVYLETYAVDLTADRVRALNALPGAERLVVILRLASLRPDRYLALYGADNLGRVLENLSALEKENSFRVYAEMPRLADNADEIDAYFERFEESPVEVILGKFNTYAGRLIERRAADLTPLHRDFCWHLARDFYLTVEGRVPLCKQDPFGLADGARDFKKESIGEILAATAGAHAASVRGGHETIPMPCLNCDEWYTFNG